MLSSDAVRLLSKVKVDSVGCWIWQGAITAGYGCFWLNGKQTTAHRASLIVLRGRTLPSGRKMNVDHVCGKKLCVNPGHLEVVTHKENIRRRGVMMWGTPLKQRCLRGHLMKGRNIYRPPGNPSVRHCRACQKSRWPKTNQVRTEKRRSL